MGLMDGFRWLMGRETGLQTRSDDDPSSLEELIARLGPTRIQPWRPASNREAMGVPAVFRALSLVSNTMGVLSLEGYRRGVKLAADDTPRLIVRPNPFTTPRVFWRDSTFHMARRGELWWWIAKRDFDLEPLSLIPVDPREITVTANPRNLLRPIIEWRGERMPNEDMVQVTYLPDPANPLRGIGPLQACGAAVSVAVEAQEWAANWFAGSPSTTVIKSAVQIDKEEASALKAQWVEGAGNLPKVIDPGIESVTDIGVDPQKAQLTEARSFQNGEVAVMFGIPGSLMEHFSAGASLTYQNVGQEFDKFVRSCLWPNYMEPIEQAMSDLLTRQTVARFNVDGLLRADIMTRFQVYNLGIPLGVLDVEEARAAEGLAPGDVENRPVPFAAPQAVPASLPIQTRSVSEEVRCKNCDKLILEKATRPYGGTCPRCKQPFAADGIAVPAATRLQILRTPEGAVVQEIA